MSHHLRSSKAKKGKKSSKEKKDKATTRRTKETEAEIKYEPRDSQVLQDSTPGNSNLVHVNTEENILVEKDTNELQVLDDNTNVIEQNNRPKNNSNNDNNKQQSFIWNYLEKLSPTEKYKKRVRCLVKVSGQPCGHIMGSDGSTGNFIFHLAKHRIMHDADLSQQINENVEKESDCARKNRLDKKFVGIIIKDDQPLSIRNDEGFCEFVKELDSSYELPSEKKMRELLVNSYNYCKKEIIHQLNQGITSCSLTLDLWTARSRAGYLGVTCSFVNKEFKLCEATLAIEYLKYPHTSKNIVNCLNQIIENWDLNGKIFTITTDNGSNMVKAGKLLQDSNDITRFPCVAHTLQLVVGKGLIPAERLVAQAKRLINFSPRPNKLKG